MSESKLKFVYYANIFIREKYSKLKSDKKNRFEPVTGLRRADPPHKRSDLKLNRIDLTIPTVIFRINEGTTIIVPAPHYYDIKGSLDPNNNIMMGVIN